jgi:uncharacterized membrane protein YfcA
MDPQIALFAGIGFVAQIIDGALGMAFGVIASSSLMAFGAPPAIASASVHAAEVFTTSISGASHIWHRNVDRAIFLRLVFTGVLGGIAGAYIVTGLPEEIVKPIVTIYLSVMAVIIFLRVAKKLPRKWPIPIPAVGGAGGFMDAIGGGGWGPLVASTLIATGDEPRRAIGSVNLAEFFLTVTVSIVFLTQLELANYWKIVLGLIIGGAIAAPLAGFLIKIIPPRGAMLLVGVVITGLSAVNVYGLFANGN